MIHFLRTGSRNLTHRNCSTATGEEIEPRKFLFSLDHYDKKKFKVSDVDNKINNALNRTSESTELQEQAKEAYVNGRDAEAVEMSDRALQSNPRNVLAHQVRGQALARLGRREEAITSFDAFLEQMPDPAMMIQKGLALLETGDAMNALDCFQSAINIFERVDRNMQEIGEAGNLNSNFKYSPPDENMSVAHLYSGNAWEEIGDLEEATKSFRKAIALDPKKSYYYFILAKTLFLIDELDESQSSLDRATELGERSFDTILLQSKLDLRSFRFQDIISRGMSVDELHVALDNDDQKQVWEFYGVLGVALFNVHRYQDAVLVLTQAIGLYVHVPNDEFDGGSNRAILHHNRGLAYISLQQFDLALDDFKCALDEDDSNPAHTAKYSEVQSLLGHRE